jgi:uncharacterized membrane protein
VRSTFLFLAAFLASAVEMVEALTIVLAVGVTRGWRSALAGTAVATVTLGLVVAALGPAITRIPLNALRIAVGGLLLVFGLQWLRKAILRAGGVKAKHDEEAIYQEQLEKLRQGDGGPRRGVDAYGFSTAFQGVLLEGLEVVFIVLTFGANQKDIPLAAVGAGAALVAVVAAGVAVHAPLARVPENTLKFVVGVMLTTFGTFWAAEGAGVHWPGSDASILGVLAFTLALSFGLVAAVRRRQPGPSDPAGALALGGRTAV